MAVWIQRKLLEGGEAGEVAREGTGHWVSMVVGGKEGSKGGQNHLPCLSMLITSTTSPSPNESSLSHMAPCLKVLGGRRDGG